MDTLLVKTRGNKTIKNKPKVYLCAHPLDFKRHGQELIKDILDVNNCAVFYAKNGENLDYENEERKFELSQMSLFVIPVTHNLLIEKSIALEHDFKFAKDHNIPVLPIVLDVDIVDDFTKVFGKIEYINKTQVKTMKESYTTKLYSYLDYVLVSNDLKNEILNHFTKHIFLSYRKKDRAYAEEILRLIHSNPKFRKVAVWFDDYLIPGEDYENDIDLNLTKSPIFTMLVTKNLVDEDNYVSKIEYVKAKDESKIILPIKCEDYSKINLDKRFKDCPNVLEKEQKDAIFDKISQKFEELGLKDEDTPESDYYIGLAYLYGFNVELDKERALEMLKKASDNGYLEAHKEVAHIYYYGNGVTCNERKAAYYFERYVKYFKEIAFKDKDFNSAIDYHNANDEYIKILKESENFDEIFQILKEEANFLKESMLKNPSDAFGNLLGDVFVKLAEYGSEVNMPRDQLVKFCDLAIENYTNLAKKAEKSTFYLYDVSKAYRIKGKHLLFLGSEEAQSCYLKALDYAFEVDDEDDSIYSRILVLDAYQALLNYYLVEKEFDEASVYVENIVELGKTLYEETKDLEYLYISENISKYIGVSEFQHGNYEHAIESYNSYLSALKERIKIVENKANVLEISQTYIDIAKCYIGLRKFDDALNMLNKARKSTNKLIQEATSPNYYGNLDEILSLESTCYTGKVELDKAFDALNEKLNLFKKIDVKYNLGTYLDYALTYSELAEFYLDNEEYDEALQKAKYSNKLLDDLNHQYSKLDIITIYRTNYDLISNIYRENEDYQKAIDNYNEYLDRLMCLTDFHKSQICYQLIVGAILDIEDCETNLNRSFSINEKVIPYIEKYLEINPDENLYQFVITRYKALVNIHEDLKTRLYYVSKVYEVCDKAIEQYKTEDYFGAGINILNDIRSEAQEEDNAPVFFKAWFYFSKTFKKYAFFASDASIADEVINDFNELKLNANENGIFEYDNLVEKEISELKSHFTKC